MKKVHCYYNCPELPGGQIFPTPNAVCICDELQARAPQTIEAAVAIMCLVASTMPEDKSLRDEEE